jgi:peptidoglycan hydrolase-like protein with peptidoglycan-binding domain
MNRTLDSKTSRVGDRFAATVTIPVYVDGTAVIPAGSIVEGRVTEVVPAKRMSRSGTIAVDFDELVLPNGWHARVVGSLTSDDPEASRTIDDEGQVTGENNRRKGVFVGGGGAIGAILGGIAGGGKGAVIGGVAGAGAGVAGILLSKGEEAQVPSGTPFGLQLKQALVIGDADVDSPSVSDDPVDARPSDRDRMPNRREAEPPGTEPSPPDRPDRDRSEPVPANLPLSSAEMVRSAQTALRDQGYYEGDIDGQMNARTSAALRSFQRENNLPQTGDLDPASARALGILGPVAAEAGGRGNNTDTSPGSEAEASSTDVELARVITAIANRDREGAVTVVINTQANTGGWRWFGEHVVNGDTLEVYARAVRPKGVVTQAVTHGRIELKVEEDIDYVRRVVVHTASGEIAVPIRSLSEPVRTSTSTPSGGPGRDRAIPAGRTAEVVNLPRQAEELLSDYQRLIGVRLTGTGIEFDSRVPHNDQNIGLLFALDSFANAAQLYSRMMSSGQGRAGNRAATLALAREARRTDAFLTTTSEPSISSLTSRWEAIRQHVLGLMQTQGIKTAELEF